ncbi:RNAse P Rpr2/Rpp21/SNM1 subunit domain-containing protein [Diplocarpon rosae]|nr:RNAse P Rpr2/Rpp21/SNM1 subunit domain-containing protein [Diplocarpon rosae]
MVKTKAGSVPHKAIHSRVSYLYQAAAYMAAQRGTVESTRDRTTADAEGGGRQEKDILGSRSMGPGKPLSQPASRRLVADLRSVSQKVLVRVSPAMKHSMCKNCDTILLDGSTCTSEIENRSRGGKKQWADVLVRKCNTCGLAKRFPLAAERQKRRPQREARKIVDVVTQPS